MKNLFFPILLLVALAAIAPTRANAIICPSTSIPVENVAPSASSSRPIKEKLATRLAKKKAAAMAGTSGKDQIVAFLLCFFLGFLGIHRFYLGYNGLGILYLLTVGLFGIGWLIDTILLIIPGGLTPKGKDSY